MSDSKSIGRPIKPQAFNYRKPETKPGGVREIVRLCQTRGVRGSVHVIRDGGGENLHSHESVDGFWMVLSGRVAFFGPDDEPLGEFGPMEGILLPRGNRYRFENIADGDSELLQVLRLEEARGFEREDHEPEIVRKSDIPVYYGIKRD